MNHNLTNRQHGLSLVELMISITIGLLVLATLSTLFVNQSKSRNELDKSNRMIDNGRYALEILSDNLRMAGYYDSHIPASAVPANTPDPCDLAVITSSANNPDMLRHPIQGYNAATQASQIGTLPANCGFTYSTGNAKSLKSGSDILVVRRASTATPVFATSAVAATTYLQVSNCLNDTVSYQIAPGTANFTNFRNKDCITVAGLRPFMTQVYFVSPENTVGDGIPTLKSIELSSTGAFATTPLVEGIEYLQVDYGLDTNADGAADSYISAPTTAQWPNIVSARINILARNIETTGGYTDTKSYTLGNAGTFGPFNDGYKRHVYTQLVRMNNPSGRMETPCALPCR